MNRDRLLFITPSGIQALRSASSQSGILLRCPTCGWVAFVSGAPETLEAAARRRVAQHCGECGAAEAQPYEQFLRAGENLLGKSASSTIF